MINVAGLLLIQPSKALAAFFMLVAYGRIAKSWGEVKDFRVLGYYHQACLFWTRSFARGSEISN